MKHVPLLILALLLITTAVAGAQSLTIYTESSGDAQFVNDQGELDGSMIKIVQEVQRRVGNSDEIKVVPWARGLHEVETSPNTILFSMTRTESREELFQWVGPIMRLQWIFFAKAGSEVTINSLEDAKRVRSIGTYRNDARETFLKDNGFTNLDSADNNEVNIRKLLANRVDLMIGTNLGISGMLNALDISPDQLENVFVIKQADLYIAFSKDTSPAVVRKWQSALDDMKADGTFAAIYSQWYPGSEIP